MNDQQDAPPPRREVIHDTITERYMGATDLTPPGGRFGVRVPVERDGKWVEEVRYVDAHGNLLDGE